MKKNRRWGPIRRIYVSHMSSSSAYKRAWIVLGCTINLIIRKFFLLRIYKNQLKCVRTYTTNNNNVVVVLKTKTLYNFTRMSTPAGNSNPINASIVCAVGSYTSITLLCVLVSKCSRESLFTCGERKTQ